LQAGLAVTRPPALGYAAQISSSLGTLRSVIILPMRETFMRCFSQV
jgi:hypothetical protein